MSQTRQHTSKNRVKKISVSENNTRAFFWVEKNQHTAEERGKHCSRKRAKEEIITKNIRGGKKVIYEEEEEDLSVGEQEIKRKHRIYFTGIEEEEKTHKKVSTEVNQNRWREDHTW